MTLRHEALIATLPGYRRWLYTEAMRVTRDISLHDDLAQEGYVAMWRALATWDESLGALPSWLTGTARMRMRDIAWGHGRWTGHAPMRGSREVSTPVSIDACLAADPDWPSDLLAVNDTSDAVMLAYHQGEIRAAIDRLPAGQRRYVLARFWGGLDPKSRAPGMVKLMRHVPELKDRRLWPLARTALAQDLAHLAGLVLPAAEQKKEAS